MSLLALGFFVLALDSPQAVAADGQGGVYYSDLKTQAISRIVDGKVQIVEPGPRRDRTPLHSVRDLTGLTDGSILAADSATGTIYRIGVGPVPTAVSAREFEVPSGLAARADGTLVVCDQRLGRVVSLDLGKGGKASIIAEVKAARDVAVLPNGDLAILTLGEEPVIRLDATNTPTPLVTGRPFGLANAIVYWPARHCLIVSDGYRGTLWEVPLGGGVPVAWKQGTPLAKPAGLAIDGDTLLVADPAAGQVFRVTMEGQITALLPKSD
jgi:hypothetical protein